MRKIKIVIEKTATGYSAYAEKYPVYTTGSDAKELVKNITEALNFYFKELEKEERISANSLTLNYSIASLFDLYPINLKHFAERVGINYTLLSQYVQGRKKPSEKQTEKIVEGLQEVGRELSQVQLFS